MIAAVIIACEIGFWVFVLAGLFCRYILQYRKLGTALLYCTPLVDLVLLIATVIHLKNGATADIMHGVAAIYIGVSVAYGHRMITWADQRFAHRFVGGPPPVKPPKHGKEHASHARSSWYRHLAAWTIGSALLLLMIWFVGDAERTEALGVTSQRWAFILAIDFFISFSYTLFPRKEKKQAVS
ncbi:membrane protein [Paenibacillus swuensis]|uniref:Membrane protein n=1 Tax=Paenibacillus swuensis TaxID=1178515 RepID=A0A172THP4_9BACL|nr:hypothetical protein [Paenibacillus swuensis]ANE46561.1 membrane protein [Paenibacillus swuensis]